MEACPADLVLVDQGDAKAELRRPEGRRVAASPRAEDDEVEVVGGANGHGQEDLSAWWVTNGWYGISREAQGMQRGDGRPD